MITNLSSNVEIFRIYRLRYGHRKVLLRCNSGYVQSMGHSGFVKPTHHLKILHIKSLNIKYERI